MRHTHDATKRERNRNETLSAVDSIQFSPLLCFANKVMRIRASSRVWMCACQLICVDSPNAANRANWRQARNYCFLQNENQYFSHENYLKFSVWIGDDDKTILVSPVLMCHDYVLKRIVSVIELTDMQSPGSFCIVITKNFNYIYNWRFKSMCFSFFFHESQHPPEHLLHCVFVSDSLKHVCLLRINECLFQNESMLV